jgi:hypothetical protein
MWLDERENKVAYTPRNYVYSNIMGTWVLQRSKLAVQMRKLHGSKFRAMDP